MFFVFAVQGTVLIVAVGGVILIYPDALQNRTFCKGTMGNHGNALSDGHIGQLFAAFKCGFSDEGNTIRDVYGTEAFTTTERKPTNRGNTIRNFQTGETSATNECIRLDFRNVGRNGKSS